MYDLIEFRYKSLTSILMYLREWIPAAETREEVELYLAAIEEIASNAYEDTTSWKEVLNSNYPEAQKRLKELGVTQ